MVLSIIGDDCEIGVADVTTFGAARILGGEACSYWCFLLCVLYPLGTKLPTTIWQSNIAHMNS